MLLPSLIFGGLTKAGVEGSPDTPILNDNAAVVENINQISQAISDLLEEGQEDVRARIDADFTASGADQKEIINPYESSPAYNANRFIAMYCAAKNQDYASISLKDMETLIRKAKDALYTFTSTEEPRTTTVTETNTDPKTGKVTVTETEVTEIWKIYIAVCGTGGAVEHASSRMLALLGLTPRDVLGKVWTDLSSTAPNYLTLRAVLHSGLTGSRDIVLADPEQPDDGARTGGARWFSARRRVVEEPSRGARAVAGPKQSLGQVFLLTEITEKKRRDALRAEMMDWISHELKTPVQSLGLAADLLVRRPESAADPDLAALVATVREDAARLRTVAAQFLDIARMSPHALELRPAPLNLRDCLPRWLQPFEPAAREAGVALRCDVAPDLPPVFLDQERFAWVLSNLVSNALRAVPEGGAVTVGAELEGEGVLALKVTDNGPGIDAELAGRLFEPFSHRRAAGRRLSIAGLGLAISRAIVEGHGGTLHYAPAPEGGSIFTVCLPLPERDAETGGGLA